MLKVIPTTKSGYLPVVIPMSHMEPLQVGRTKEGHLVMRTASTFSFEVMNLSIPGRSSCWTGPCNVSVTLLPPDEKVTIELFNE